MVCLRRLLVAAHGQRAPSVKHMAGQAVDTRVRRARGLVVGLLVFPEIVVLGVRAALGAAALCFFKSGERPGEWCK